MTLSVSTATLSGALRRSVLDTQLQLVPAQLESSTGRLADLGASLGANIGRDYALAASRQDVQAIAETNKLVATRLDATQSVLTSLSSAATGLRSTLLSAQTDGGKPATIKSNAGTALNGLISGLNTTDGSTFIFGGINSDTPPVTDYSAKPAVANKQAVDNAFSSYFGFSQSDSAVGAISATQMQGFLDGPFASLFSGANWKANWSSASDEPVQSRISVSKKAATSVSANDPALQKLAMAYTMVSDLGLDKLDSGAYQAIIKTATNQIDAGLSGLNQTQSALGIVQKDVSNANDTLTAQDNYLALSIEALESVDPYEAATKVSRLTTQLETSYTLTSKIQQLSLAKYL